MGQDITKSETPFFVLYIPPYHTAITVQSAQRLRIYERTLRFWRFSPKNELFQNEMDYGLVSDVNVISRS